MIISHWQNLHQLILIISSKLAIIIIIIINNLELFLRIINNNLLGFFLMKAEMKCFLDIDVANGIAHTQKL